MLKKKNKKKLYFWENFQCIFYLKENKNENKKRYIYIYIYMKKIIVI